MSRPIIAVDVDDVCADLLNEWLRRYNEAWGDTLRPEDLTSWEVSSQVKPECGNKVFDILRAPDLYRNVQPFPDALPAIEELRKLGRVVYVSSCGPGTKDQKVEWLQRHGFLPKKFHEWMPDFVAAADKSLIQADVLFDDHVKNIRAFRRLGILVARPHNRFGRRLLHVRGLGEGPELLEMLIEEGIIK